jgi:hypothetical protein
MPELTLLRRYTNNPTRCYKNAAKQARGEAWGAGLRGRPRMPGRLGAGNARAGCNCHRCGIRPLGLPRDQGLAKSDSRDVADNVAVTDVIEAVGGLSDIFSAA